MEMKSVLRNPCNLIESTKVSLKFKKFKKYDQEV